MARPREEHIEHLLRRAGFGAVEEDVVRYAAMPYVAAVESEPVDLIETVAERIANLVLEYPSVESVDVTVHKPSAPIEVPFADVAVTVRRSRA